MFIASLICCVVAALVVLETLVGRPPEPFAPCGPGGAAGTNGRCRSERLPALEAVTRAVPLLLAGLGLPLAVRHPLLGISCLLAAAGLFAYGMRRGR
ncbi:hypothetical protein dsx2_3006 [Desulfovibrio sp. X2]|uniref:hypothetical protein n=1 Tax=Desulfovibrio sp. X2 TaxID=941449 RepID=UPI0003589092|nr:hypothetical protein [Desulfovibrio sp. X2]EPR41768.1 hypothetical protein dsx2_3006 [Desulfovibrio sp. X2]